VIPRPPPQQPSRQQAVPLWSPSPVTTPQVANPPPQNAPRRRRQRSILIAGVLAFLLGGSTGVAIGWYVGAKPKGPTDLPKITGDFPNADQRYLQGVTVSDIADSWLAGTLAWTCEPSDTAAGLLSGALKRTECTAPGDRSRHLRITIDYDDNKHVREVDVMCTYGPGHHACEHLFVAVAGILLASDAEQHKQALNWAGTNVDSDASTVIGNVRLLTTLSPHSLRCTPAG
jgi:hypothetical protein